MGCTTAYHNQGQDAYLKAGLAGWCLVLITSIAITSAISMICHSQQAIFGNTR
jgi:hypothetical protein